MGSLSCTVIHQNHILLYNLDVHREVKIVTTENKEQQFSSTFIILLF